MSSGDHRHDPAEYRPVDRQELEATLADALKAVESEVAAPDASHAPAPGPTKLPPDMPSSLASHAQEDPDTGELDLDEIPDIVMPRTGERRPNPFGRAPTAAPAPTAGPRSGPAPGAGEPTATGAAAPRDRHPAAGGAAQGRQSAGSAGSGSAATPTPQPGPTLLGSGAAGSLVSGSSPLGPALGRSGNAAAQPGNRGAGAEGPGRTPDTASARARLSPTGLSGPLGGSRVAPGLSASTSALSAPPATPDTPAATIPLRRPNQPAHKRAGGRSTTAERSSSAAQGARGEGGPTTASEPSGARVAPTVTIAAWAPQDDDILPRSSSRRRGFRRGR